MTLPPLGVTLQGHFNVRYADGIPVCCANGYEDYYPVQSAYGEGGYEALPVRYVAGTAEKLIEASTLGINSL